MTQRRFSGLTSIANRTQEFVRVACGVTALLVTGRPLLDLARRLAPVVLLPTRHVTAR